MVDKTLKSFFAATGAWRKIPLAERASQGAKRSEKIEKVTLSLFRSVSTRAAVRRQVTVVRAAARGAKFPFSSRGPPKKRKSPLIRADFRQYFLHNPVQPKKISRPQARNDLDRKSPRPVRGDLHFAQSASETPSKKRTAMSSSFLKCFTESRSASRSPPRSSSACSA